MTADSPETSSKKNSQPGIRDMLLLETPYDVRISPDGSKVAYCHYATNWKDDVYETICVVVDLASGMAHPLNQGGRVNQMEWVNATDLALLKKGPGAEANPQIYLYEGLVGEGWPVTDHKTGVEWFKPFAGGFVFRARNPERDEKKARADQFGKYVAFEQEDSAAALYYVGLEEARVYRAAVKAATEDGAKALVAPVIELSKLLDEPLSIRSIVPSPAGDALYLNAMKRDDLVYFRDTSSYRIRLDARTALAEHLRREKARKAENKDTGEAAAGKKEEKEDTSFLGQIQRLNLPAQASVRAVSPDGTKLLVAHRGRDDRMFTREDLWRIDLQTALLAPNAAAFLEEMTNLTAPLDSDLFGVYWVESGIYAAYPDGCQVCAVRIGEDGHNTPLDFQGIYLQGGFHVTPAGTITLIGANATTYPEAYLAKPSTFSNYELTCLTNFGMEVEGWDLGSTEVFRWKSKDGMEIEGVLRKPANFDPSRKYPLVFVVHGGPRGISEAYLITDEDRCYYPAVQFIQKDMLVLKPNYRGSTGRGQAFGELNVNNLGIGDLWDLESAIDDLAACGWVDPERVGCMGWSQGGYISAFAGLHSDRFKAVSVGAGISDWYTYHISNDIPDFTTDYLSGSPFRNRQMYQKTAPIANLANAKTPMLIQHGTDDHRVPFSNAMELYRGLKEMGVPVRLFAFPGMGHPITKPRENHAVMSQNLAWFSHYLLGEDLKFES